jgi:hypothetical protein
MHYRKNLKTQDTLQALIFRDMQMFALKSTPAEINHMSVHAVVAPRKSPISLGKSPTEDTEYCDASL